MSATDDVADRVAILDLHSRYCFAIDPATPKRSPTVSCPTASSTWSVVARSPAANAIKKMIAATAEGRPRHMYMNPWIKGIDGDTATSTSTSSS